MIIIGWRERAKIMGKRTQKGEDSNAERKTSSSTKKGHMQGVIWFRKKRRKVRAE